jgi:hypothetical protein
VESASCVCKSNIYIYMIIILQFFKFFIFCNALSWL